MKLLNKIFIKELIIIFSLLFVYNNYMIKKDVVINADGRGYYEYLPALFIYNDIHFEYLDTLETDYYSIEMMNQYYRSPVFEQRVNKYFAGTALLQSPFFAVAHLNMKFGSSKYKPDGFSKPYQRIILYAAIFYLFLGLVFIQKLLKTYNLNGWWIFLIQLSILYCGSLFTYTMYDSAYSHVYSFALISSFLFVVRKYFISNNSNYIFWTFILLGLIVIVRPVNLLAILFIPFLANSGEEFIIKMKELFLTSWKKLLLGLVFFTGVLCIQFYISYLQTGHPLNYNYGDEGFNFLSPRFYDFLFSYHKGFFLWSPWWFLIFVLGAIFWIKAKKYYHFLSFFLAFTLIIYVTSSWWHWSYGGSHGSRPMVDFYSAFALLAIPIYNSGRKIIYGAILLLSIPLAVVNLIQAVQYQRAIINWDGMNKESYWEVFLNTDERYQWYLWRDNTKVGKKQSEVILIENIDIQPTIDEYQIGTFKIDIIDSLSMFAQFSLVLDREVDNEFLDVEMYDSKNNKVWGDFIRFFKRQEEGTVTYNVLLPDEKFEFKTLTVFIKNVKEPLKIKKATFSTYYN